MSHFEKVKHFLLDLDYNITQENEDQQLVVIENASEGIQNMVIDCEDPILIMEQYLFSVNDDNADTYKKLLMMNRNMVHGALVLDEEGKKVIFRDTLELENLDLNEIEGSINSLSMFIAENFDQLISFSKS